MQFSEGHLYEVLFGHSQHFKIPDFQRAYSWDRKMWAILWIDILHQYKIHADLASTNLSESDVHAELIKLPKHYLGAVVTTSGSAMIPPPSDVLDGQQRLLTSSIVYLAIRDSILRQLGTGESTADLVEEVKENFRPAFFNQSGNDKTKYRLLTQDVDRSSWEYLLSKQRPVGLVTQSHFAPIDGHSNRVIQAFNYFFKEMNRTSLDDSKQRELEFATYLFPLDLHVLKSVVETRLTLVRLMCDANDDANAIFESLNAKSEALKQVDLIKNYIYISLPADEASDVYRHTWRPMEVTVGSNRIERFVWAVVVSKGNTTLQKRTYETVRGLLANRQTMDIRHWVEDLAVEAKYYKSIVSPGTEADEEVRKALHAIQKAGGATMEPLLMYAYRAWATGQSSKADLILTIKSVESYLVRRMIAGEKTQLLNPIVTSMINKLYAVGGAHEARGELLSDIRRVLSVDDYSWSDSEATLRGLKLGNFYSSQKPEQRQHVLRALDAHLNTSGVIPNYEDSDKSIEHIIPQTPSLEWTFNGESIYPPEIRERIHSLSNLCLLPSTVNACLGNKGWEQKVEAYADSPYSLTSDIADRWGSHAVWGLEQLDERAVRLAAIVDEIWPLARVEAHFMNEDLTAEPADMIDEFDDGAELDLEDD